MRTIPTERWADIRKREPRRCDHCQRRCEAQVPIRWGDLRQLFCLGCLADLMQAGIPGWKRE